MSITLAFVIDLIEEGAFLNSFENLSFIFAQRTAYLGQQRKPDVKSKYFMQPFLLSSLHFENV